MEIKEIKELMEMLEKSSIAELEFSNDDYKIKLKKEKQESAFVVAQPAHPITPQIASAEALIQSVVEEKEKKSTVDVLAPLVGVYYQGSSPEAEPFVKVGQAVNVGDTVCILAAMKVLNEIKAPASGTVVAIHVKNGDVVEFNQVLLEIG